MSSISHSGMSILDNPVPPAAICAGASDDADAVLRQLNHFLCDEISAELSYRLTADRLAGTRDAPYVGLLRQLQEEHGLAAESLREHIRDRGGEAADLRGSLGLWGPAARCGMTLFGQSMAGGSALECLKAGEDHNLTAYLDAAGSVDAESAHLLNNLLIPAQRRHARILNELLGQHYGA